MWQLASVRYRYEKCWLITQDLQRATSLFSEMVRCGVERNVHTYTALMNVCIKCQNCAKALETYNTMRQSGCFPNVVTYNTLIECAPQPTPFLACAAAHVRVHGAAESGSVTSGVARVGGEA